MSGAAPREAVDKAALLEVFLIEAGECVTEMRRALRAVQTRPDDGDAIDVLFRLARVIAGSAPSVGLHGAAERAYALQVVLQRVRSGSLPVTEVLVALLRGSVDRLGDAMPLPAA